MLTQARCESVEDRRRPSRLPGRGRWQADSRNHLAGGEGQRRAMGDPMRPMRPKTRPSMMSVRQRSRSKYSPDGVKIGNSPIAVPVPCQARATSSGVV